MSVAQIQLPDGRIAEVEIPDGMDMQAAQSQIQSMYEGGQFGGMDGPRAQQQPVAQSKDSFGENTLDVLGEFAASANRSVTELVDFLGPNAVNNVLSLTGSQARVPTLTGALDRTGIQGGFMEPGAAREVVQAGGALTTAGAGMAPVARQAGTVASSLADLIGAGSSELTRSATRPIADASQYAAARFDELRPRPMSGAAKRAEIPLKRRDGNADTFGYQLDNQGRVVSDPRQAQAAKQGVEEKIVTMLRDSPPKARERMRSMLDIVEQSGKDAKFEAMNRPGDIVGESITLRTRALLAANRTAGRQIDGVAKSLKGQAVDVQPAMQGFVDDLDSMGIQFDAGQGQINFTGSDIEGLEGPEKVITRMINRLYNSGKSPDAYDVHRMKRWIDEQVTYGKSQEGLSGKAVNIMKSLRRNLDGSLDAAFPEYNRINTNYSETRQALDTLQDAAGKRIDITGENAETALGTLSRRVLGNAVSRQDLMRALGEVDDVARKVISGKGAGTNVTPYRPGLITEMSGVKMGDLDDGLIEQIRFVSQLESMFGTNASNSFLGDIAKATDRSVEGLAVGDKTGFIREGVGLAVNKFRGINEENAMKSLRELLKDSK